MKFKAVYPPDYISPYLCLFDQFVGRAILLLLLLLLPLLLFPLNQQPEY